MRSERGSRSHRRSPRRCASTCPARTTPFRTARCTCRRRSQMRAHAGWPDRSRPAPSWRRRRGPRPRANGRPARGTRRARTRFSPTELAQPDEQVCERAPRREPTPDVPEQDQSAGTQAKDQRASRSARDCGTGPCPRGAPTPRPSRTARPRRPGRRSVADRERRATRRLPARGRPAASPAAAARGSAPSRTNETTRTIAAPQ